MMRQKAGRLHPAVRGVRPAHDPLLSLALCACDMWRHEDDFELERIAIPKCEHIGKEKPRKHKGVDSHERYVALH